MYTLVMTEKPSVAKDIAEVIGALESKKTGYYEGNGYRVTWAVGHLVGLSEPEAYGYLKQEEIYKDNNKERAMKELPLLPIEFKLKVLEGTEKQFYIIKDLINDENCSEIINAGDFGAEGHILQWFIREMAGCKKKVRRFCATSMTKEAIQIAMNNLRKEEDFENLIKGEFCKKKADWIMGMSISRAGSLRYNTNFSAGRVQSPTLYFIVKRFLDVQSFQITNYYGMIANLEEGFSVYWNKDENALFSEACKDSSGRVLDKVPIQKVINIIQANPIGVIKEVKTQKRATDRPQLYDITELQRDANRIYGYTASQTLAAAQALYETQKVLSYPRTDSRYITSDLESYMKQRITMISTLQRYKVVAEALSSTGLNIDKKIVNDEKVTDHHALIVTEKIEHFDIEKMDVSSEERAKGITKEMLQNILHLVICRMLVAFSRPYLYLQTIVEVEILNKINFTASGKKPISYGWKNIEKQLLNEEELSDEENKLDEEQIFPNIEIGQKVTIKTCEVVPKKTTPPKLHTEATLLTAMENAGGTIEGGEILKGRGIGTQATRAEIIKKLFEKKYVTTEKKGKINYIVPTQAGLLMIKALPSELYSPKITADWENMIAQIADGKKTEEDFMNSFIPFIKAKIEEIKYSTTEISFKNEKESYGNCPFCHGKVYKGKSKKDDTINVYYCQNFNKGCCYMITSNNAIITTRTGKKLSDKQIEKIIQEGSITLECKKKIDETKYKMKFTPIKKIYGEEGKEKEMMSFDTDLIKTRGYKS